MSQSVWNKHYNRERSNLTIPDENVVRYVERLLRNENRPETVLDAGCGSGRNLAYLQSLGLKAYGCDFAIEGLWPQRDVVNATISSLPFSDKAFDLVIVWGVFHYLESAKLNDAITEVNRILKPGGRLFTTYRSSEDTHLQKVLGSGDLARGSARLFDQEQAAATLKGFSDINFGYIMRIPLGEKEAIAHHVVEAIK